MCTRNSQFVFGLNIKNDIIMMAFETIRFLYIMIVLSNTCKHSALT